MPVPNTVSVLLSNSFGTQRGLHMNPHESYIMTHTNGGLPSDYTMVLACNRAAWIGC